MAIERDGARERDEGDIGKKGIIVPYSCEYWLSLFALV